MKICVISSTVFSVGVGGLQGYGGLEQIAWQTAKGLATLGHEVTLVSPDESSCPGCKVFHTGPPGRVDEYNAFSGYNYRTHQDGKEVERKHPPFWPILLEQDVIIDHSWQKWSYTLKVEGVLKVPVLGVLHAPINTMYSSLPAVDKPCFVTISEDQASHFRSIFNREAKVVYNGVDPDFHKPMNIPRTDRFLFLARFSTIKGPDLAIEACMRAGVGLDLVGDTSITNEPEYLNHCKNLCDGEQIRMVGPCSRSETVWWYSQARAFLHPNQRFREPFGLAPVEAMMCGLPVVAWNYGAMRETLVPAESGMLADTLDLFVDHIKTLKNIHLGEGDRVRCRNLSLRFSVDNMVNRYEWLCEKALETGGW